jgi:hypothetical protein
MKSFTINQAEVIFAWEDKEHLWFPRGEEFALVKNYLIENNLA